VGSLPSRHWAVTLIRPIRLDFLGPRRFAAKAPDFEGWISLDFLGFSRPKRDFSMSYADFSVEIFSSRFPLVLAALEEDPSVLTRRSAELFIGQA
jgi:hypothetical protein